MLNVVILIIGSLGGAYLLFICAVCLVQNHLIFYPGKPDFLAYRKFVNHSVELRTNDGTALQGWVVPQKASVSRPATHLIYFGGNAQEAGAMIPLLKKLNVGFISIFNYRGYGLSEGRPDERSLYSDGLEIYDFIRRQNPETNIVIMGHSLGSAIAGHVARCRTPKKLILSSPLHSIEKIATENFYAPAFAVKQKFALSQAAPEIVVESLVLIAKGDPIIPNSHSYETAGSLAGPRVVLEISNVDHNSLPFSNESVRTINAFIVDKKLTVG